MIIFFTSEISQFLTPRFNAKLNVTNLRFANNYCLSWVLPEADPSQANEGSIGLQVTTVGIQDSVSWARLEISVTHASELPKPRS